MISRHRLEDLELEPEERVALQRQGFVSVEKRANGSSYFKLRFRCGGHQRVRGLGNNPAVAEQVRRQVQELQAKRRRDKELMGLTREAHVDGSALGLRVGQSPELFDPNLAFIGAQLELSVDVSYPDLSAPGASLYVSGDPAQFDGSL